MNIRQLILLLIVLAVGGMDFGGGIAAFMSRGSASEVKIVTEGVVPSALASVELMSQLKDVQIATLAMVSAPDADTVTKAKQDPTLTLPSNTPIAKPHGIRLSAEVPKVVCI